MPRTKQNGDTLAIDPSKITSAPLGSLIIQATHGHLKSLSKSMDAAMGQLENPGVRGMLDQIKSSIGELTMALEGGHGEQYPDEEMKACGADCDDDEKGKKEDGEYEDEEAVMKSFLATALMKRYSLGGVSGQLGELATARNLTPKQKSMVAQVNDLIGGIVKEAEQAQGKPSGREQMLESRVKSLADQLTAANKVLEKALPHPK